MSLFMSVAVCLYN